MSQLTLQLDPVALREATSQAILGVLTPEIREKLMLQAISAIMTTSTNSWNQGETPLSSAFGHAVEQIAKEECKRYVTESPDLKWKLEALVRQAADKVFNMNADKLAERMADALVSAMSSDR